MPEKKETKNKYDGPIGHVVTRVPGEKEDTYEVAERGTSAQAHYKVLSTHKNIEDANKALKKVLG